MNDTDTTTKEQWLEEHAHDVHDASILDAAWELADGYPDQATALLEEYQGLWNSDEDFAHDTCDEIYDLGEKGSWHPANYIDWERVAHDLMMDYCEHNGHYFRSV